ncbi:MAG TPA: ParB/RepB/Spo0J family partition protein [Rhizomicrobium sp.]|jgi:ParB family chromosome partitioning protein
MSGQLKAIPLGQLKPSKHNVRKTDRGADIEALAANIEANGLLENLVVRPIADGKTDSYEVIAGGRRLAALKLLAKRKVIGAKHAVNCLVLAEDEANVAEVSLSENFARMPLHPADQFEAFAALAADFSAEEIAARFGVSPIFVAQRLKLASVSPRLVAEYRKGDMTLEQLTAFTVTDDQAAQEAVWFNSPYDHLSTAGIRRLLTQSEVEANDRRARFIGLKAYEEAGGIVVRDLFDEENEGYLADGQLLDRLVAQKLEAAAETVRAEGWSWVEVHLDTDLAGLSRFERAEKTLITLEGEDQERLVSLCRRYDNLAAGLEEQESEDAEVEFDRVSVEIAELQSKRGFWSEDAKAGAGAIVGIDWQGGLHISRGLVRPDEKVRSELAADEEIVSAAKHSAAKAGYADSVVLDLSAHRTAVLRVVIAQKPSLALGALVHAFVEQLFYRGMGTSCLSVTASEIYLDRSSDTVAGSRAASEFAAQHEAWQSRLPELVDGLWPWIVGLGQHDQLALLAHCAALTVNALETPGRPSSRDWRVLAQAASVDMRDWWQPTAHGFLNRLTKKEILVAVSEGASPEDARRLDGRKKEEMASAAEKLLEATRWLPLTLISSFCQLNGQVS